MDDDDAEQRERVRFLLPVCLLPLVRLDDFVDLRNPQCRTCSVGCVQVRAKAGLKALFRMYEIKRYGSPAHHGSLQWLNQQQVTLVPWW